MSEITDLLDTTALRENLDTSDLAAYQAECLKLLQCLDRLFSNNRSRSLDARNLNFEKMVPWCQALSLSIVKILCAPDKPLHPSLLWSFGILKGTIEMLFSITFHDDPLAPQKWLSELNTHFNETDILSRQAALFTADTLEHTHEELASLLISPGQSPYSFPNWVGIFCNKFSFSPGAWGLKQLVADFRFPIDQTVQSSDFSVDQLAIPWMNCPYTLAPEQRAGFKRHLNELIVAKLSASVSPPCKAYDKGITRPKCVVIGEAMHPDGVMFVCFIEYLKRLSHVFDVHLACDPVAYDVPALISIFGDKRYKMDEVNHIHNVNIISALEPDLVYFPSVGFKAWGVVLANLRFAPVQILGLGQPDGSQSDAIDYLLSDECYFDTERPEITEHYREQIVLIDGPQGNTVSLHEPDFEQYAPRIREQLVDSVNVAVLGSLSKLNPETLSLCQRLSEASEKPIHFHFFPHIGDVSLLRLTLYITSRLAGATVYPSLPKNTYLELLAGCDFAFGNHPYSGSNSIADALKVGTPPISIIGEEPRNRSDLPYHRRVSTERRLCVRNYEEMLSCAQALIEEDELRVRLAKRGVQHAHLIFKPDEDVAELYVKSLQWVFEQHEALQINPQAFVTAGQAYDL